jgi:hypothetical protein
MRWRWRLTELQARMSAALHTQAQYENANYRRGSTELTVTLASSDTDRFVDHHQDRRDNQEPRIIRVLSH